MKTKFTTLSLLIVLIVLVTSAFTVAPGRILEDAPPAPTLPAWSLFLITAGATWLVTAGIKSAMKALPWLPDLTGWGTTMAAAIVNGVVLFGNGFLASLPPSSYPAVTGLLVYLGTLFSSYGLQYTIKRFAPAKPNGGG